MRRSLLSLVLVLTAALAASTAHGQFIQRAVGGVSVDATGVVKSLTNAQRKRLANDLRQNLDEAPAELAAQTKMRMISLKGLQQEILSARESGTALPDKVRFLAGLQRVQYVFVYPEHNDIVLAGPAESWHVGPTGDVVGVTTGQPVLNIDDLIVAFQSTENAYRVGISCSIDPTAEGRQALNSFLAKQTRFSKGVIDGVKKALGPQKISLTGVPTSSHFASVLVASDYRMKRFAMNLERAPVKEMPSFLNLVKSSRTGLDNMMPRWWMACNYDSIAQSEDGLSWQLRGQGVKVMTEDEFVAQDGSVTGSGSANPVAQKWADTMTAKYNALAKQEPIFGQLRNIMDLSVVSALIAKEQLAQKADCDMSVLVDEKTTKQLQKWNVPQTVSTESSFIKRGGQTIITASGGVQIESWDAASKTEVVGTLKRPTSTMSKWWN